MRRSAWLAAAALALAALLALAWLALHAPTPEGRTLGQTGAAEPNSAAAPRLTVSARRREGFVGGPVLLDVRLLNMTALRQARDRARARSAAATPAEASGEEPPPKPVVEPLPLAGDWRQEVRFFAAPTGEEAPSREIGAPALLSPADGFPTSLGAQPALATWAWPPESTTAWQPGRYRVTAELDASAVGLPARGTDSLQANAEFGLAVPREDEEAALLQETVASYASARGDCEGAIAAGRAALALDRQRQLAYQLVAECEAARGSREEAAELYEQLLELLPPGDSGSDYRIWVENRLRILQREP